MSATTRQHQSIQQRPWARVLTRGPRVIAAPPARTVVTVLILAGAVLTVLSGVLHLYLWGEANGYRQIATIGPLFLAQGIAAAAIGLATAVTRWLIVVLAAAGTLAPPPRDWSSRSSTACSASGNRGAPRTPGHPCTRRSPGPCCS